jgi:16S rRNA (adenine1518-N6/adenine1519-N6)-dimethyltransferase
MSAIDDLPPLREVIERHGLAARKALGQNFLLDLNLTARIARAAGPLAGAAVVEIGPGPGGLTRALLAAGAGHVFAVERDERCRPALEDIAARYPGRLSIIMGDALQVNVAEVLAGQRAAVVANLPYNIATPLVVGWLRHEPWPPWWLSLTVMVQREVAERFVATPADPADYGRLSVLTGWRAHARIMFDVPPTAFVPQPKVMSSVVHFQSRAEPMPCPAVALEQVTLHAFGQRRKMLRQSLKSLAPAGPLLEAAGIAGERRAETLQVAEFVRLARVYAGLAPEPA